MSNSVLADDRQKSCQEKQVATRKRSNNYCTGARPTPCLLSTVTGARPVNRLLGLFDKPKWASKRRMRTNISFQEATRQLRVFLQTEKRPSLIRWVFRDDLLIYKRNIFLRWPLPKRNELQAEALFYRGQKKGLGLALEILGFDQTIAYAYILVPEDSTAAAALMMTSLKFSYVTDQRNIIKIKTRLLWQLVKKLLPDKPDFTSTDFVPLRNPT